MRHERTFRYVQRFSKYSLRQVVDVLGRDGGLRLIGQLPLGLRYRRPTGALPRHRRGQSKLLLLQKS